MAGCGDKAYWGAFRPTAWVLEKAQAHHARVHGGAAPQGRPQRRNAAARPQAGVLVDASVLAALQGRKLGQGIARQGFALGDMVLKRAINGRAEHNRNEWDAYHAVPAHVREWLCPPLAIAPDGSWLLVRKAENVGNCTNEQLSAVRRAIGHLFQDLHAGNIGMLDGHPVATDYGFGLRA
jgi:hypothetical protein